jgi:hypothetical protein
MRVKGKHWMGPPRDRDFRSRIDAVYSHFSSGVISFGSALAG